MTRRAILHIGVEKTGTTTLQMFLQRNRARLLEKGFVYPRFCGEYNHTGLAAFAMNDDREDPLRLEFAPRGAADVAEMRHRMAEAARLELAGGRNAIFCNEHCHSRLTRPEEVQRLKALLEPYFDRIDVCIYLRRQDRLVVSLYATYVRSGGDRASILPPTDSSDMFLNYEKSLGLWSSVFSDNNVHPIIFDHSELMGGSIIDDFVLRWGLGAQEDFERTPNENEPISTSALEFLRRLNPRLAPVVGPVERVRGPLAVRLGRLAPGAPPKPARAEAEAFLAMFAASNEAVRRHYFPKRASLFEEGFDDYPVIEAPRVLSDEHILDIAARLHEAAMVEKHRLEHEIALRESTIAGLRGDWRAAETAARLAIRWMSASEEARHALAMALSRQDRGCDASAAAPHRLKVTPVHEETAQRVPAIEGGHAFGEATRIP